MVKVGRHCGVTVARKSRHKRIKVGVDCVKDGLSKGWTFRSEPRGAALDTASASGSGIDAQVRWSLRLLGGFELKKAPGGDRVALPGKRERMLLALLALCPNGRQPRRALATLLWGDAADETLLDNLRTCVWRLRKALNDTEHRVITSEGDNIVLETSAFAVDAFAFRRLATQSDRINLEAAANLYTGELLGGGAVDNEEFESWRRGEATRYRDLAIDVLTRLMTQCAVSSETERAIELGTQILQLEPFHESAVRYLMRLYSEAGRRGTAIQLYRTLEEALCTELNAEPDAETRAVFAEIARTLTTTAAEAKAPHPTSTPRPSDAETRPKFLRPPLEGEKPAHDLIGGAPKGGLDSTRWEHALAKRSRPAWVFAGGLAAALAVFLVYQFAPSTDATTSQKSGVEAANAAASFKANAIAIAVLPFANLSGDPSQEFFSDGLTEEITTALAKIRDLRVVGRTSAYQFENERKDLRAIGQALAASHLIEGSVRREANHLRITAQLIEVDSGLHVWTESYDRELTGVFAIQEEIATAIAGALRVPLGLPPGGTLVSNRDIDPDSYRQFLSARALLARRGPGVGSAIEILEPLVARNANYAPAWAQLASAYSLAPIYHPTRFGSSIEASRRAVDELLEKADVAAQRAVQLDPGAVAYAPLGYLQLVRGKLLLAEDAYRRSLALDPNSVQLQGLALLLAEVGRLKEALALKQQLQALEPFVPLLNRTTGLWLWVDGQTDAAIAILKDLPNNGGAIDLAMIYASLGRYAEAADLLENLPQASSKDVARLLRTAPAKAATLPQSFPAIGFLDWVFLHVGAPERAFESFERDVQNGWSGGIFLPLVWHASFAPARKTERFKAFARDAGLVEYWRARGWLRFCHPTTGDDFECN
jgi:TolB-like protein/DNA-binding SARP family transcriptional activator